MSSDVPVRSRLWVLNRVSVSVRANFTLFFSKLKLTLKLKKVFDFEKLEVYKKSKILHSSIRVLITDSNLDKVTANQLRRASLSICLNLAEGSGRFTNPDRRNFYIISRSSVFEVAAILDILRDEGLISTHDFNEQYRNLEEISKMIFAMIKRLSK